MPHRLLTREEWAPLYAAWRADKLHLPSHFRAAAVRGCATKVRYDTHQEAAACAKTLPVRPGFFISVYACEVCAIAGRWGWHCGNTQRWHSYVNGRFNQRWLEKMRDPGYQAELEAGRQRTMELLKPKLKETQQLP